MIRFILIPVIAILSCGSTKSNKTATLTDTTNKILAPDFYKGDSTIVTASPEAALPGCIKNKIDSFKTKQAHEKPQRVLEYMYKGNKVYYVVMPCCDFFNEVYDDKCNFLGAPDGGFTGRGDGKLPDFFTEAKGEKLVWGTPK